MTKIKGSFVVDRVEKTHSILAEKLVPADSSDCILFFRNLIGIGKAWFNSTPGMYV